MPYFKKEDVVPGAVDLALLEKALDDPTPRPKKVLQTTQTEEKLTDETTKVDP